MPRQDLKEKIEQILKQGYFNDPRDLVDVTDGPANDIHVLVVSRKYDTIRGVDEDPIWDDLESNLEPEELEKVTVSIGVSPEQLKAI